MYQNSKIIFHYTAQLVGSCEHNNEPLGSINGEEFFD